MKSLIAMLQIQIAGASLSSQNIDDAISLLRRFGYKAYDEKKFPALRTNHEYGQQSTRYEDLERQNSPTTLAEAMLWKLGKWNAYKSFVRNYYKPELLVANEGGVVMTAFAKHLQNQTNPIYDQHAVRSLWAIAPLNEVEFVACKSFLIDGKGYWKESGSGQSAVACYELFVKHTSNICERNSVSLRKLDHLLMPLGQALKIVTGEKNKGKTDFEEFKAICGF